MPAQPRSPQAIGTRERRESAERSAAGSAVAFRVGERAIGDARDCVVDRFPKLIAKALTLTVIPVLDGCYVKLLDGGRRRASTTPLFETGSDFRPGALIPRIRLEIGQPNIKKGTLFGCLPRGEDVGGPALAITAGRP